MRLLMAFTGARPDTVQRTALISDNELPHWLETGWVLVGVDPDTEPRPFNSTPRLKKKDGLTPY